MSQKIGILLLKKSILRIKGTYLTQKNFFWKIHTFMKQNKIQVEKNIFNPYLISIYSHSIVAGGFEEIS